VASNYQQTIVLNVDKRQLKAFFKDLGLVQKRIQKINQTGLQLNRVRSRTRNIKGTGLNLSTSETRQAPGRNPSARVQKQTAALNKANAELNKYVRTLGTADGAQRGFTGSANKMSTQVSALRDRLRGLARSNSEYTSTLQAVQRGEQALFQDRNKRLGDQSRTLGKRGGTGDLVTNTLKAKNITQSIDGLNNYISRLETLKNKVNINSKEFKLLENRIAEVNIQLNEAQLMGQSRKYHPPMKPKTGSKVKTAPSVELGSIQAFTQQEQYQDKIRSIDTQRLSIQDRIYDSEIKQADKLKLINQLEQTNLDINNHQLKTARENNIQVDKQLKKLEGKNRRRGRIASSAGIGAGFPLLFGGGPLQALAGGIGGGLGESFTPGGGFAGSIVATAVVQTIQQTVTAIADLGKAMGPFTQNTEALTQAMGFAGTAEGARIKIIEQLEGKQAAFNAAMQKMNETVGTEATKRLKDFGEKASLVGSEFRIAMTRMQASLIPVINLVDRLFGISANAQRLQRERTIKNSKDVNIQSRVNEIEQLRGQTGGGRQAVKRRNDRIKLLERELKLRADVEIIETNIQTKADELTLEFAQHVKKIQEKADLEKEIAKLMAGGMKQSVAEQIAQNNILADQARKRLEVELEILKAKIADPDTKNVYQLGVEFNRIKKILQDLGVEQDKINKLTEEYGKKTEKVKVTKKEIADLLANELTNAITGLIDGTKTLTESLSSFLRSFGNMLLQAGMQSLVSKIIPTQAQGAYNRAGGFKAFQQGGVVNSPTMGLIGEGGESEYVIPASKMAGAMARYSAGARGGNVIPGGSGDSGTVAGSTGNTIVEYTGPTLNFNGDEYVPKSAVPQIIGAAAKQGAMAGKAQVIGSLKNSRSQRSSLGL
tara:strand:+ start:462 stop:3113 length:2652 start_codon:yes stop_codon:yes gene_type:complete